MCTFSFILRITDMSQPAGTDRRTNYAREETMTFGEKFNYKMDQFRDIVSGACCSCLGNCPSIALIITTLLIILTIVAGVAYTIINTSSSKLSSDFTEVALKSKRVKFWPSVDKIGMPLNGDLKNELRGISMESLFPSNVSMCTGFGFACTDSVYTSIATSKRCDGKHDCGDKSDEENCKECQTIFSCPARVINDVEKLKLRRNKNYKPTLICLTASQLCDGVQHCPDGSDETEFCKATCSEKEFKCNGRNICLPLSSRCNGVNDCDDGSDELECKTCHSGSHLCGNKCIESNKLCDGVSDCEDGSDEMKCDCKTCSGTDKALCDDGTCILRSQVCDGRNDCSDGMDERDCPGSCLMTSFNVSKITCSDGRDYTREEACSGEFEVCESSCDRCDPKLAFECPNTTTDKRKCIPRRMICDGIKDCFDGADEMNCECDIESGSQFKCLNSRTCIDKERRCDGVFDCHDGSDEKECSKCDSSSLRCESDRSCLPASSRCNGIVDCSDGSDEKNCSCEECVGKHSTTYLCEGSSRCLRRDEVCSPYSMCPNATRTDKAYCASMALKLSDKLPW